MRPLRLLLASLLCLCAVLAVAVPADADGPAWRITSTSAPTIFKAGDETGEDVYVLSVINTGGAKADGSAIEVLDTLPAGLTAAGISGEDLGNGEPLSCALTPAVRCAYEGFEVAPGDVLRIEISVDVQAGVASHVVNAASVTGGGATGASTEDTTTIGSSEASFGIASFLTAWSDSQAGAHANMTTAFTFNQVEQGGEDRPAGESRTVELRPPPGFFVNPNATPTCPLVEAEDGSCPASTAVGVVFTSIAGGGAAPAQVSSMVYNLTPVPGELVALSFTLLGERARLVVGVDSDRGDGLSLTMMGLRGKLISLAMTLWGVPTNYDDSAAGPDRVLTEPGDYFGDPTGPASPFPLLSNGATCGSAPASALSAESWLDDLGEASAASPPLSGCDMLGFEPSIAVVPENMVAAAPSGYELEMIEPWDEFPAALAMAGIEKASIRFPLGTAISLSSATSMGAEGLLACAESQARLYLPEPSWCPSGSAIGRVTVRTPLSERPLEGHMFLATPHANPFGSLLALYLVAEGAGAYLKIPAELEANPVSGQLTLALDEIPALRLNDLELRFEGGPRALLANPTACGAATTTSELTPWSEAPPVKLSSSFSVEGCASRLEPGFEVTTTTGSGGGYDALKLELSRSDGEPDLSKIALVLPGAVEQMLSGAPLCEEPEAAAGACAASSEIGTLAVDAGPGPTPAGLGGRVYLTGPYRGEPLGLSIVVPVLAGPFDLGTIVVRGAVQPEPATGMLEISLDPLPIVLDGIPLRVKSLTLDIDRGEFRLAGGCEALTATGTVLYAEGGEASVADEQSEPPACVSGGGSGGGSVSSGGEAVGSQRAAVKSKALVRCHARRNRGAKGKAKKRCPVKTKVRRHERKVKQRRASRRGRVRKA